MEFTGGGAFGGTRDGSAEQRRFGSAWAKQSAIDTGNIVRSLGQIVQPPRLTREQASVIVLLITPAHCRSLMGWRNRSSENDDMWAFLDDPDHENRPETMSWNSASLHNIAGLNRTQLRNSGPSLKMRKGRLWGSWHPVQAGRTEARLNPPVTAFGLRAALRLPNTRLFEREGFTLP